MTPRQRLELRQSEIRERLNELLAVDEPSEDESSELNRLTNEFRASEPKLRAAIISEGAATEHMTVSDDSEGIEFRKLHARAHKDFSENYLAAWDGRANRGANAELRGALNIDDERGFALQALVPAADEYALGTLQERTKTDVDGPERINRWVDRLFNDSAARHLGVTFQNVPPGTAGFMRTATGPSGAQRGREEGAATGVWTINKLSLKPTRNTIQIEPTEEDMLRDPGLGDSLIRDIRMAMADSVDLAIFKGDAGANEDTADITGLQTAAITEITLTQAQKSATGILKKLILLVDGKYASSLSDLNLVISVGLNQLLETTLVSAVENQTVSNWLRAAGVRWMTRGGIDTATAADDFGGYIGLRRGIQNAAIAAIWNSGRLTRDRMTKAGTGIEVITLSYFWNFGLLRADNFKRLKFVT